MNANIISYNPGPYIYDGSVFGIAKEADKHAELSLSMTVVLRYSDNDPTFGLQFDINYEVGEKRLLRYGFVIGMVSKEMEEYLKSGKDLSRDRAELIPICAKAWNFAAGLLAAQSYESIKGEFPQGLILPPVSPEAIAKDIILDKR